MNEVENYKLLDFLEEKIGFKEVKGELLDTFPYEKLNKTAEYFADKYIVNNIDKNLANTKVGILYDTDVDGLFSGYTIEDTLSRLNFTTVNYINPNKIHGLTKEGIQWALANDIDALFIVDGGSGDENTINTLTEYGIEVFVLDHHPFTSWKPKNKDLTHIMNVTDDMSLPQVSGCGIVYRFCEKLGKILDFDTDKYLRFVGLTVISDICSINVPENRFYVDYLYEYYEKYGKQDWFYKQFTYYGSKKGLFGWSIAPFLNAMIRIGNEKQAVELVNSMNVMYKMNAIQRKIKSTKDIQKELLLLLEEQGQIVETEHTVIHLRRENKPISYNGVERENTYFSTLNGLLANKLLGKYNKNALVLYLNEETKEWKGSFRGFTYTKHELMEYGLSTGGHDYACGVWGSPTAFKKFLKNFDFNEYNREKASIHPVDATNLDNQTVVFQINIFEETKWHKPNTTFADMPVHDNNHRLREIAMLNEFAFTGSGINPIQVQLLGLATAEKTQLTNHPSRRAYRCKAYSYVEFGEEKEENEKSDIFDVSATSNAPYFELIRKDNTK